MICPGCGGQVPEGSYQCPFCGAPCRGTRLSQAIWRRDSRVSRPLWTSEPESKHSGQPVWRRVSRSLWAAEDGASPCSKQEPGSFDHCDCGHCCVVSRGRPRRGPCGDSKDRRGSAAVEEQLTEQQRDDSDDEDAVSSDDGDEADERGEADDRDEADERDDRSSGAGLASADDVAAEISASFDQVIESSFDIEKVRDWGVAILDLMPPEVEDLFELSGYTKDDIADALMRSFLSSDVGYYAEMLDLINFDIEFYVSGDMPQEDLDMVSLDMALLGISDEVTDGKWIGMRMTGSYGGESMSEETDFIGYCAIEIDGDWFFWSTSVDDGSVAEIPEDVSVS